MYKAVRDYLTEETAVWSGIVANATAHSDLTAKITAIDDMVTAQGGATTGHTAAKNALRAALEAKILLVANATANLARANADEILLAEVDLTPSGLAATSDQLIDDVGARVIAAANTAPLSLMDYGLTALDVPELQAAIDAFDAAKPAGDVKRAQRAGLTAALEPLFAETSALLKDRMDTLLARYKATDPAFHAGYEAARVIIDLHGPGEEDEPVPPPVP